MKCQSENRAVLKYIHVMEEVQKYFCILMLSGIVVATVLQVFSRYILNHSYMWTEELARTLGIWLVMVGAGLIQRSDEHLGFNMIPERLQHLRRILTCAVVIVFSVLSVKPAFAHLDIAFGRLASAMPVPLWMIYAAIPVGMLNLFLWALIGLTDEIMGLIQKK